MISAPTPPYQTQPPQPKSNSTLKFVLLGCLGSTVLALILLAVGAYYIVQNASTVGAGMVRYVAVETIKQIELPEEEKVGIIAEIDRVVDLYRAKKISLEDLSVVMEQLAQSPILPIGMVYVAEQQYLAPGNLSTEERARASRDFQRLARGVYEQQISGEALEEIVAPIMVTKIDGQRALKERLSQAELAGLLERVSRVVEAANIPDEPFVVSISGELRAVVDQTIGMR